MPDQWRPGAIGDSGGQVVREGWVVLPQPSAQHRTIVVIDVAGYTNPSRTMTHLLAVQEGLHEVLEVAFGEVGIDLGECLVEYLGDGALILIPSTVAKSLLADHLPARLDVGLRRYNATHNDESKVKLRVGLHAGEIVLNTRGAVSKAVNHAFRILDAAAAKAALAESDGVLALIASLYFFDEVIAQDPGMAPETYRQIPVNVKQTRTEAWLRLPGVPIPPAVASVTPSEEDNLSPLDVLKDTDLEPLRQMLTGIDVPHLAILVRRAAGSDVPLPRRCDAWYVFNQLSDYNAGPDGVPPNLAFLDLLAWQLGGTIGSDLTEWVNKQAIRFRLTTAFTKHRSNRADIEEQQHLHLVFAVQQDSIDESRCRLTYWRQVDPHDWPPPRGRTAEVTVEDLEHHVDELIVETEMAWSTESVAAALEFVMPRTLLHLPVHLWQKEHASGTPRPLYLDYQVTVRSLDRLQSAQWHRLWRMKWHSMREDPSANRVYFSNTTTATGGRIDAILSDPQWVSVVMAEAPLPHPRPNAGPDEMISALRSGIPVIFWHPTASSEEIREIIEWLVTKDGLLELSSRIDEFRKSIYTSTVPFDTDLARDLAILFDDPTRMIAIGQPISP